MSYNFITYDYLIPGLTYEQAIDRYLRPINCFSGFQKESISKSIKNLRVILGLGENDTYPGLDKFKLILDEFNFLNPYALSPVRYILLENDEDYKNLWDFMMLADSWKNFNLIAYVKNYNGIEITI
jgi:hypothetical protein